MPYFNVLSYMNFESYMWKIFYRFLYRFVYGVVYGVVGMCWYVPSKRIQYQGVHNFYVIFYSFFLWWPIRSLPRLASLFSLMVELLHSNSYIHLTMAVFFMIFMVTNDHGSSEWVPLRHTLWRLVTTLLGSSWSFCSRMISSPHKLS